MAKFSQLRKVKQPHFSLLLNKFTSLVDNLTCLSKNTSPDFERFILSKYVDGPAFL